MIDFIQGEKFEALADNKNIFYCHTHDCNNFFKYNTPSNPFILISHNSDGKITPNPTWHQDAKVPDKLPSNLIKWFGQNVCTRNNIINAIPIGLENNKWFPSVNKKQQMINKLKTNKKINNLLYINHNIYNNSQERSEPYKLFSNKKWCTIEYGKNISHGGTFEQYLENIFNHKFVLCPEGVGPDTHRTWECLYMKTIPIEKYNINNSFFRNLPICFVNKWSDITEDFLMYEYERISKLKWNISILEFKYWADKILKIYESRNNILSASSSHHPAQRTFT